MIGDQAGRVGLRGVVVGARALQRQPVGDPRVDLQLDALDVVVRAVDAEGGVAELGGVEEQQLNVVPLHVVRGHVHLQAVVEELGLHADLVVGQRVRAHSRWASRTADDAAGVVQDRGLVALTERLKPPGRKPCEKV